MASAASFCNFLQIPSLWRNPNPSSLSPVSAQFHALSLHSRHPFPLSLFSSSLRPPSVPSSSVDPFSPIESPEAMASDPSLRHANILFFKSAYNVHISVDDNEPEEALLRRFRREVLKAGVIQECKRRRFFENKQEEKKRKARDSAKRNRRRRSGPRFSLPSPSSSDADASKKPKPLDDEDDNWEMPEGDLP